MTFTLKTSKSSFPPLQPGIGLSARLCDLMNFCIDNTTLKNEATQLNAATLFARSVEHTMAVHRLLKSGDLLSAYTVARSNLETGFCLGALAEKPEEAFSIMKHSFLKEEKKALNNLILNGHDSFSNGTSIQEEIDAIKSQLKDFKGVGSSAFDLATIADYDYIVYRFLSPYAHPASMICATRTQFGPDEDGPSVRVNYKDKINSEQFVMNAAVGIDCLRYFARVLAFDLNDSFESLSAEIGAALGPDETEINQ